jgi:hypothetical protein
MRIEILHQRDPDSECDVRLFLDGAEVTDEIEFVDVDPGRGHDIEDWLESKRFAMDGASAAAAAAVADAYDAGSHSPYVEGDLPSGTRVHFQPQAWVNDYAINVDDEGEDTWEVSERTAEQIEAALDRDDHDWDFVRWDSRAPSWVRSWTGPFYINIVELREE